MQTRLMDESLRKRIIAREKNKCAACGYGATLILKVHHIHPVSEGGDDTSRNLVALCPNCHDLVHKFGSISRFHSGRATLLEFGLDAATIENILKYAACIAEKSNKRSLNKITEILAPNLGSVRKLPTLNEAIETVCRRNELSPTEVKNFSAAVRILCENIPDAALDSKTVSFRLTHKDRVIASSAMNYLLFRLPSVTDRSRDGKDGEGAFVIIPSHKVGLFPKRDLAFDYKDFPCVMVWLSYTEVANLKPAQIEAFREACIMASQARRSRIWPSTIRVR
jgi:hypothetical protein